MKLRDVIRISDEKGAAMMEYALMAACIAVVAIASVSFAGEQAELTFTEVGESIAGSNFVPENQPGFPG